MHGLLNTAIMPSPQKSPLRKLKGWIKSFGKRKKGSLCQGVYFGSFWEIYLKFAILLLRIPYKISF